MTPVDAVRCLQSGYGRTTARSASPGRTGSCSAVDRFVWSIDGAAGSR
jgi:hypothetical protein